MAYSGVYVFGDSLVDSGNALKLAEWYGGLPFTDLPDGAPTAEAGYFKGRFSDGYTFVDLLSNKAVGVITKSVFPYHFEDPWLGVPIAPFASDPSGKSLNFAYGGSHIRQGDEVVPDLDDQTDAFRDAVDGHAPAGALYLITTGGNDIRDLAPTGNDPVSQADAYEELQRCADKLFHELSQLIDDGAHNIVITGIPDVGLIPHYDRDGDGVLNATEQMRSDAASDYSVYLDMLIRSEVVPALKALGANVTYVPLMDHLDESGNLETGALSANLPTIAALHGITTEELTQNLLEHKELVFFDHVHPNAQAHALLAAYMQSLIAGTPWIETLPLTSAEVDYSLTASITVAGEVDQLVIAMVAGTTYTFDMLGVSSLGTGGSLADPALRLLGPTGAIAGADDDSGAGFDATLTFTAAGSGSHTLQLFSIGSPTGSYLVQAAVVGGPAMMAGNSYTIGSASTLVLEGAGGIGQDIVKASISYALASGSEIEVLRTTNDQGKTAINLTGNEIGQNIVGNAGGNILDGKGGTDTLTGGGGQDIFVLGKDAGIDRITDYAKGEIVDISQVLGVAAGINVATGGYLRVTTSGLIQADLNGGANEWVTLGTVNGNGAVTLRYLSGGSATTVSIARTADTQQAARNASANMETIMAGAIAAAGLAAIDPTMRSDSQDAAYRTAIPAAQENWHGHPNAQIEGLRPFVIVGELGDVIAHGATAPPASFSDRAVAVTSFDSPGLLRTAELPETITMAGDEGMSASVWAVGPSLAIPSAELITSIEAAVADDGKPDGDVARLVAAALDGAGSNSAMIDSLLDRILDHSSGTDASFDALRGPIGEPAGLDPLALATMASQHGMENGLFILHPDMVSL